MCESGDVFYGQNSCDNPQTVCPRTPGEGYEKCKTICQQQGHAETMALARAAEHARGLDVVQGATAYCTHSHFCKDCQIALFAAGVKYLTLGKP